MNIFFSFSLNIPAVNQFLINCTLGFFFYYCAKNQSLHRTAFTAIQSDSFSCFTAKIPCRYLADFESFNLFNSHFHRKKRNGKK